MAVDVAEIVKRRLSMRSNLRRASASGNVLGRSTERLLNPKPANRVSMSLSKIAERVQDLKEHDAENKAAPKPRVTRGASFPVQRAKQQTSETGSWHGTKAKGKQQQQQQGKAKKLRRSKTAKPAGPEARKSKAKPKRKPTATTARRPEQPEQPEQLAATSPRASDLDVDALARTLWDGELTPAGSPSAADVIENAEAELSATDLAMSHGSLLQQPESAVQPSHVDSSIGRSDDSAASSIVQTTHESTTER